MNISEDLIDVELQAIIETRASEASEGSIESGIWPLATTFKSFVDCECIINAEMHIFRKSNTVSVALMECSGRHRSLRMAGVALCAELGWPRPTDDRR